METPLEGFAALVDQFIADWDIPGAAVCVVKDGAVVHSEGYGYRDVARQLPVTAETQFAIGSASKAFTCLTMGILVDQGKLAWDTPVRDYMPDFRLHDPVATERMTPRDLVIHNSGLPRHDLAWYNSPRNRHELLKALRHLPPTHDFRSFMQYQNLMFMTAGILVERLSGQTWEEFAAEHIFKPLEMDESNFTVAELAARENRALAYHRSDEAVAEIPYRNIDNVAPAGSINSTVRDMAQWLRLHLGHIDGVVSEETLAELHTPQMVIRSMPGLDEFTKFAEISKMSYCLGWFTNTYRGYRMIHHGGGIDGFASMVTFFPELDLGAVVLTNRDGHMGHMSLIMNLCDRYAGLEPLPWSKRFLEAMEEAQAAMIAEAREKLVADRIPDTAPSRAPAGYAGTYAHPGYGPIAVTVEDGRLNFRFNNMDFGADHYHFDTFTIARKEDLLPLPATFYSGVDGKIERLELPIEPTMAPLPFQRQPDDNGNGDDVGTAAES